jgi:hypothetical protein
MSEDVIEFTRKKPFKKIKNIGEGAFGKTVLEKGGQSPP